MNVFFLKKKQLFFINNNKLLARMRVIHYCHIIMIVEKSILSHFLRDTILIKIKYRQQSK